MAEIIQGSFPLHREAEKSALKDEPVPSYQLRVTLAFSDPPIWRRIVVPGRMTLDRLHQTLQLCMGWTNSHTHQFLVGKVFYEPVMDGAEDADRGRFDESRYQLHQLEDGMRFLFTYIYDFGDAWEHEIHLEEVIPPGRGKDFPVLLDGERACPPEDVGGMFGYMDFLEALADPKHKQHRSMVQWLGRKDFDPEYFEIAPINEVLRGLN